MVTFSSFWDDLYKPSEKKPRIGFTDSTDPRVLKALLQLKSRNLIDPVLFGDPASIQTACHHAQLDDVEPKSIADLSDKSKLAALLQKKSTRTPITEEQAIGLLDDPLFQAIAWLLDNRLDGVVGGATRPTADIVKAAIQFVGPAAGVHLVSGHFLIETEQRTTEEGTPFVFADCAVVPEPSSRSLAAIAQGAAASYRFFTSKEPRVAMLSFSTRGSAAHELVDRVKEAVALVRKQDPALTVDGEMQVDAALDLGVAKIKNAADSQVSGKANVLVFPTLEAGNTGYKLVQRFSNARVAGPILWGLSKPMSDLSRGCTVQEVMDTTLSLAAMIRRAN